MEHNNLSNLDKFAKIYLWVTFFCCNNFSFAVIFFFFAASIFLLLWSFSFLLRAIFICRRNFPFAVTYFLCVASIFLLPQGFFFCGELFFFLPWPIFFSPRAFFFCGGNFFLLPWPISFLPRASFFCRELFAFAVTRLGHRRFGVDITRVFLYREITRNISCREKFFNAKIRSQVFKTNPTYFWHCLLLYFMLNKSGNEIFSA